MSHLEQSFWEYLSKHPEVESCVAQGLVNRRALARHLIKEGLASSKQLEAVVAMLRRFPFEKEKRSSSTAVSQMRISIKDRIQIHSIEKNKENLQKLQKIIQHTDYDKGDILKIVVGTEHITLACDQKRKEEIISLMHPKTSSKVSEISLHFPSSIIQEKGILSSLTRLFTLHDIVITDIMTSSPELLIYLDEKFVLKAYELLKDFQK